MKALSNQTPLVFLHGFLGSKTDWDPVCSYLSEYECIQIELPGHGNTPFTEDFFKLIPQLPKMHLIGYSMGGRLAMQFAKAFETKVEKLTLLSAHCGIKRGKKERRRKDIEWTEKITQSFDAFLDEWYKQPLFGGFTPNMKERKKHNPKELVKALTFYGLANQEILNPKNARFVVGEKDIKYRKLYPDAIVVPNASHMVHLENPEFVASLIRE